MSTTYQQILHSVALRSNALVGSQAGPLNTTYLVSPLTASNFKSADFPFESYRDSIIQAEGDFVAAVSFAGEHPWRDSIRGLTSAIATNGLLPKLDSNSKPIVGTWGAIYDAVDNTPLVEMPIDVITRRNRNANTNYVTPVYYYKINGNLIHHTRTSTNVILECCIYLRDDQVTAYNANGNMLLPDLAESGIIARALSYIFRDGAYTAQAATWRQYSDDALGMIRAGGTSVVPKSVPVPITLARPD